jgi:hypothetical protein
MKVLNHGAEPFSFLLSMTAAHDSFLTAGDCTKNTAEQNSFISSVLVFQIGISFDECNARLIMMVAHVCDPFPLKAAPKWSTAVGPSRTGRISSDHCNVIISWKIVEKDGRLWMIS